MTKELDIPIEKPIKEEKEIIEEEIKELTEEIKMENKEIYDMMQTNEYKIMFNAIYRALIKAIDYMDSKNLFSTTPGETKTEKTTTTTTTKKDKEEDYILENVKVKFETDKAYLLQDENDQVAWIPKKCMKSLDTIKNIAVIHGWFKEKVQFEEEEPFEP